MQPRNLINDLANLESSGLDDFKHRWPELKDYSSKLLFKRRDELRLFIGHRTDFISKTNVMEAESDEEVFGLKDPRGETKYASEFRNQISQPGANPQQLILDHWLEQDDSGFRVNWDRGEPQLAERSGQLASALCLLCMKHRKRLKICDNPKCEDRPYYLATRRDQKFCGSICAEVRQQAIKRRWWDKHRSKAAIKAKADEAKAAASESSGEETE